jgi:Ca2+-binding RTX toxin-like protein
MTNYTPVPYGSDIQVNTHTTGSQRFSTVTALADGGFVVTWSSDGQDGDSWGIYGQRFASTGAVVGGEFQINTETTSDQAYSSVTALADGGFVVTWSSFGQDGSSFGIYGQRYDASGAVVGGEFQINTETTSDQAYSSVTALADGAFVVTWSSLGQDGDGYGIYGQRYDASGAVVGGEFQVNTETTNGQLYSSITALADGGFVVTWSSAGQDGSSYGIFGQRFDAAGAVVGSEFQINSYTTIDQHLSSVTALAGGGFVVTWSSEGQDGDGWGIHGQRYDSAGAVVGGEFQINTETAGNQIYPSVTSLADRGFVVTWSSFDQDGDVYGVYGQRYDADGNAWGDEFSLNDITTGDQIGESFNGSLTLDTLADGRLVATWTGFGTEEVFVRLIDVPVDPTPQPTGNDIQVNTYTTGEQRYSTVTALADGGFVVTWSSDGQDGDGWGVYGQRYDASGAVVGGEFQVNTETTSDQFYTSVTALADGGFVVTWSSFGQDGDGWGVYGQRYDASGAVVGGEFQVNTETTSQQIYSSVTALADGGFVVTWSSFGQDGSGDGIYGQRYDSSGAAVGGEFQINTETTSDQFYSSVTALADGGFVVTWSSNGQDGDGWGVYGQRYDAAGAAVGGEFQINTYTTSAQIDPSVTALADGGFVVTWSSFGQDGSRYGIYGQRYDASGAVVGGEFQINTETTSVQIYPSVTALADGGFVVTWSSDGQDGDGYGIYGQRFDDAGLAVGREFRLNDITAGQQIGESFYGSLTLDTLADGRLVATWTGFGTEEVFVRLIDVPLDPTPQPTGDDIQVNTYTTGEQRYSTVTALADGGFVVTWSSDGQDGDGWGVYGQRYDASGAVVGGEFQVNTETTSEQIYTSVTALADGGFVVTWSSFGQDGDGWGIHGQRYDAAGAVVGGEFQINTETTNEQIYSSVTALADGGLVVTWSSFGQDGDSWGIFGQRYDASGAAVGGEFQINTETTNGQLYSSVTALADGGFVVTWSSNGQDGDNYGIYGQRYDAAGTAVGSEFLVNTVTFGRQDFSRVTALADGGFVVTWSSNGQDGDGWGIYGQRYDASGAVVGGEFQINSYTTSAQIYSSVTALADGGFVVTWSSNGQDGDGYGVYGQRYDATGAAVGREFRLNDITTGHQIGESFYGSLTLETLADGRLVATWTGQGTEEVFVRIIDVPNDASSLDTNTGSTVIEGGSDAILASELDTNDGESADTLITYTLDSSVANGTLYLDLDGSGTFNAGDTELIAASTFTQADINNGRLRYDHDGSETTTDSFQFDVSDGTDSIDDQTFDITVSPVNDDPVFAGDNGSSAFTEDGAAQVLDSDITISDAELDALNSGDGDYAGASLTIARQGGADAEDSFSFNMSGASFTVSGGDLQVGGNTFATFTNTGGTLTISFTSSATTATRALVDEVMQAIAYENTSDAPPASVDLDWTFSDGNSGAQGTGGALADSGTTTVNITAVDDPAEAIDDAFTVAESGTITSGSVFAANPTTADSDPDSALVVTEVNGVAGDVGTQITLASGALLTLNANGTFEYDPNGVFDATPGAASGASNLTDSDSFTYQLNGGDTATVTITITGEDSAADDLYGTIGADTLDGGIGGDAMMAGRGDDTYIVDHGADTVTEGGDEGFDRVVTSVSWTLAVSSEVEQIETDNPFATTAIDITGNELRQNIIGNSGNNIMNGGAGVDTMRGLAGNDTYIVDTNLDLVFEAIGIGNGNDTVRAMTSYSLRSGVSIENLTAFDTGATTALNLYGNELAQTITGNAGVNVLVSNGGNDTLIGLGGDDRYYVSQFDTVVETSGGGNDRLLTSTDYKLGAAADIELFTTSNAIGTDALNLTGNALGQTIRGNYGNNRLDGGGGTDTMQGYAGDDRYVVDSIDDIVLETVGQGNDRVLTSVSYTLGAGVSVEMLTTTVSSATTSINLTGNELAQTIQGNQGANTLDGGGGPDILTGFGGSDIFRFTTAFGAGNIDHITDFNVLDDTIHIAQSILAGFGHGGTVIAQEFFASTLGLASSATHRFVYDTDDGKLFYDADGVGGAAAVEIATLSTGLAMTNADFFVI